MRLYFAYGSNMAFDAMARRCPNARLIGRAKLPGRRFAIIRGRHGTALRQKGASVHGALWRLGRGDSAALDLYEEIANGLYRRERCVVESGGRPVAALIYIASRTTPGRARAAYLSAMVAAARRLGFPDDYRAALEAMARTVSGETPFARSDRKLGEPSRLA